MSSGCALCLQVMGDGVLTPAQSVLGAIYGLQVKTDVHQSELPFVASACDRPHTPAAQLHPGC